MTRQEIIDNYGFDPGNYTVRYYFDNYELDNACYPKYNFFYTDTAATTKSRKSHTIRIYCASLMFDQFHDGLFYSLGYCDLSYLLVYNVTIPVRSSNLLTGGWLLEHTTGKFIVLCPLNYKEYFYEHSPVDMAVGQKC